MLTKTIPPTVLTIAGSDPSGGAGVQADLKTFTMLQVYGCAAITALTIQNTMGVHACHAVAPEIVHAQIRAVLDDMPVSHIKIGMVGSRENLEAIGEALSPFQGEIIFDPVLSSSSGHTLLEPSEGAITDSLLAQKITVITPNHQELQTITGQQCLSPESSLEAAARLFTLCPSLQAVILKGGHLDEDYDQVTDYLLLGSPGQDAPHIITAQHPRLKATQNTHGTGCTFASAFTAHHMQSASYETAFQRSVSFIDRLLSRSQPFQTGKGTGGLIHYLGH